MLTVRNHLLLLLFLASCGRDRGVRAPDLSAELDRVMTDAMGKREMPGAALVVIDSGRVVFSRGYGYADLGRRLPFTDTSHFIVGSTSKPITAMAVLRLVARQQLALDTPIVRYVPEITFTDPRGKAITLRHLLTNRSGMVAGFSGAVYRSPAIQDSAAARPAVTGRSRSSAPVRARHRLPLFQPRLCAGGLCSRTGRPGPDRGLSRARNLRPDRHDAHHSSVLGGARHRPGLQ